MGPVPDRSSNDRPVRIDDAPADWNRVYPAPPGATPGLRIEPLSWNRTLRGFISSDIEQVLRVRPDRDGWIRRSNDRDPPRLHHPPPPPDRPPTPAESERGRRRPTEFRCLCCGSWNDTSLTSADPARDAG